MSTEESLEFDAKCQEARARHPERFEADGHIIEEGLPDAADQAKILGNWQEIKKNYDPNIFLISKLQNEQVNMKSLLAEITVLFEEMQESFNELVKNLNNKRS